MAQDYGAAQPIADVFGKIKSFLGDTEKPATPKKVDTGYSEEMLKKANESFEPKTVAKKQPQKTAKKRTNVLANKRVPRKR